MLWWHAVCGLGRGAVQRVIRLARAALQQHISLGGAVLHACAGRAAAAAASVLCCCCRRPSWRRRRLCGGRRHQLPAAPCGSQGGRFGVRSDSPARGRRSEFDAHLLAACYSSRPQMNVQAISTFAGWLECDATPAKSTEVVLPPTNHPPRQNALRAKRGAESR